MPYNRDSDEEFSKYLTVYGDNKMTDAEQIETWRKEFETEAKKLYPFNSLDRLPDNSAYIDPIIFHLEKGFLLAKRSQPVIELPEPEDMYDKGDMWIGRFIAAGYVHNAIIAAGYKYKFKE